MGGLLSRAPPWAGVRNMRLRRALLLISIAAVDAAIDFPEGWIRFPDRCFSRRGDGTNTQIECDDLCGHNASLVHIDSAATNEFIFTVMGDLAWGWIGYYKQIPIDSSDSWWDGAWGRWTILYHGTDDDYTNWAPGPPANSCGNDQYCTYIAGRAVSWEEGAWYDSSCTSTGAFGACLCEYPARTTRQFRAQIPRMLKDGSKCSCSFEHVMRVMLIVGAACWCG